MRKYRITVDYLSDAHNMQGRMAGTDVFVDMTAFETHDRVLLLKQEDKKFIVIPWQHILRLDVDVTEG